MVSGYDKYGPEVTPNIGIRGRLWLVVLIVFALAGALGWLLL